VTAVLQTLGSDEAYRSSEPVFAEEHGQGLNFSHYFDIFKRRFFYLLLPFGLISILGLYLAAIQKPNYFSEGKILVESQVIAPDLVRPVVTATASERIQLIQQRIMTRDKLLSVANKFGLFPRRSGILDLMPKYSDQAGRRRGAASPRHTHNRIYSRLRIRKPRTRHESGE
jgi:hypothetical protein